MSLPHLDRHQCIKDQDAELIRIRRSYLGDRILETGLEVGGLGTRVLNGADDAGDVSDMNGVSNMVNAVADTGAGGDTGTDTGREIAASPLSDEISEIEFWR